jgi:glycosyltransferase involved in cell wall biosynthesis
VTAPLAVGLDLTCLEATLETGVERYARRLAETLPRVAPHLRTTVIVREGKPAPATPEPGTVVSAPASFGRALWRETVLPRVVRECGVDVLHAPVAAVATLVDAARVVTIHDVPDPRRARGEGGLFSRHRLRIHHALSVADAVITPSFATRDALERIDGRLRDRTTVIPHGVDCDFRPFGPSLDRSRYGLPTSPYVLCVATIRSRKGHETLIRAFARAAEGRDLALVLAGKHEEDPAPLVALAATLGMGGRVFLPGYVAREDLPDLYREAAVFALASRIEGFGLPLLEAMASGAPVVASDAASIPEVVGDAALLFPADDDAAAGAAIASALDDATERARLRERGFARAAEFTWDACARRHAEVYVEVAARRAARGGAS